MGGANNASFGGQSLNANPFIGNVFSSGGMSQGKYDYFGNAIDKADPYVAGPKKNAAAVASLNANAGNQPQAPSMVDANGSLLPQYAVDKDNYNTGKDYLSALGGRATATGESPWAKMQNQTIDAQTGALKDQAAKGASNAVAGGMSDLAQNGGLDSGARERLTSSANLGAMNANQDASLQGNMAKLNTGVQDENQKLGILQALPGMYQNNAGFDANIDNKNIQNAIDSQMYTYGEKMKGFTGDKMAAATLGTKGKK